MATELPTRQLRDAARAYGDLMADLGVGPQSHAAWQQFCDAADELDACFLANNINGRVSWPETT